MDRWILTHALATGLCLIFTTLPLIGLGVSVALLPVRAAPDIIYVKADATGAEDGSSWENAYTDLHIALAAAQSGDEIWVAAGTYRPTTGTDRAATFQLRDGVALYGGFTGGETVRGQRDWEAHVTVLNGDIGIVGDNSDNSYHVVTGSGVDGTVVLDGFTITGGNADGDSALGHSIGGGMYNDHGSPTLANCTFSGNFADYGGGMYNEWYSDPTLANCTFSGNFADWDGGGMYNYWYSDPTLTNCTFSGNAADRGGGMYNWISDPVLVNCTFSGNAADRGGGMYSWISDLTLSNCTFSDNSTTRYGGGMYLLFSDATLTNNVIADNQASLSGSALYVSASSSRLWHTTIAHNYGGGSGVQVTDGSTVALTNTILVSHTVGITVTVGNTATLEATLWYGNGQNIGGAGTLLTDTVNIYGDPAFVAPGAGDYHIGSHSAAIDRGVEAGVGTDVDHEPRPYQIPDLGADEYWPPGILKRLYWPLALKSYP